MRSWLVICGMGLVAAGALAQQDAEVAPLHAAQKATDEAPWPPRPDRRLSPLSGKTRATREVSLRYYGQEKEYRSRQVGHWHKEASLASRGRWEGASSHSWQEARWNREAPGDGERKQHEDFSPRPASESPRPLAFPEVERRPAPDWSSRGSVVAARDDGTPKLYQGRLTRVRQQVWQEDEKARDLGPGRKEKFSPAEVEKMLSEPVGEFPAAARERSPAASPLAAAGN